MTPRAGPGAAYARGMRKLIVSILTSLDGYYEGPGKDLSGMPFEDAFNTHNLELLGRAGTLVYGSTWFEDNWNAWTAVAADESANDRDHEIASIVTSIDAVVISDTLVIDSDAPWAANTRVVPRADGAAEIERLKHQEATTCSYSAVPQPGTRYWRRASSTNSSCSSAPRCSATVRRSTPARAQNCTFSGRVSSRTGNSSNCVTPPHDPTGDPPPRDHRRQFRSHSH